MMQMPSLDFLEDNLRHGGFEAETRDEVRGANSQGTAFRSVEGWPVLRIERHGVRHVLDGPLHYEVLERIAHEPDSVVIVFGLGMGNFMRTLRAHNVRVAAVFEPDPGILRSFLERGPSDLNDVALVSHERELETLWSRIVGDRDNVHIMDTPGYSAAFRQERLQLNATVAQLLERNLVNEQTFRARGRVWVEDIIDNAAHMASSVSAHHLQGAFSGVPAFIVGAGPSLAKNIEQLRRAHQKGIVLAVNSSAKALDVSGIQPHILACLESIDVSHLIRDLSYIDDVVRVFSLTAHPQVFETGGGPLMTVYELLPHIAGPFEGFFGRAGLPVCGSVSTACFSLAYRMGCSPIVMVGQDLAYTDGHCYAKGTVYEGSRVEFSEDKTTLRHDWCETMVDTHERAGNELLPGQKLTETLAWGGAGQVHSASTFNHVRTWFERIGALLNRSDGPRLVNATEGGARIDHFEEMRLEDILDELPDRSVTVGDIVRAAEDGGQPISEGDVVNLLRMTQRGAESVATAARVLCDAAQAAELLWDGSQPALLSRRLRELQYAEAELRTVVRRHPWVDAWAWDAVDDAMMEDPADTELPEALRGIRSEKRLANAIIDAANELAARLEVKQHDLRVRFTKKS